MRTHHPLTLLWRKARVVSQAARVADADPLAGATPQKSFG